MITKQLSDVQRGDQVLSPRGTVTVTSFTRNWSENFRARDTATAETTTLVGTLPNGKRVTLTAPGNRMVEVTP